MNLSEKLANLQASVKAAKNRRNEFGNYYYRNLEDIYEAAKPHLTELGLTLMLTDEVVQVGERFYIKATASLADTTSQQAVKVTAYARETDLKKGMDVAQITGATSSYARKYALSGLLLLDDNQDPDTQEPPAPTPTPKPDRPENKQPPARTEHNLVDEEFNQEKFVEVVKLYADKHNLTDADIQNVLKIYKRKSLEEINNKNDAISFYVTLQKYQKPKAKTEGEAQ